MRRYDWLTGKVNDWKELYRICKDCGDYYPIDGAHFHGERISVPEFEMVANPTVRWGDVARRRYNALDRAQERMRQTLE